MEIHLHERNPHFIGQTSISFPHFFLITLIFQYFHSLNFLLPCAYLLLERYSIHVFHEPELVLFSFSGFTLYLTPPRSHALY